MLKSTYRVAPIEQGPGSLPSGWTEHKAPTGHTYYYNAETKQSTYTRPTAPPETEDLQIDYNATAPDEVVRASMTVLDEFHKNNPESQRGQGHFRGGKAYQDRSRRNKYQDRPRSKVAVLNFVPWVLVKTKFGRRFVHNTETKDSFWKFPQDVMLAVHEMDRLESENKKRAGEQKPKPAEEERVVEKQPIVEKPVPVQQEEGYDSDEYEEVEVTDDEGDDESASKRVRVDEASGDVPPVQVEFDEDDIAYQLAQMEEDEYRDDDVDVEDDAGEDEDGLPLTAEDSVALFRSLLDDRHIDPYSTFEALIEYNNAAIIDDPRWVSLTNMSSRRTAFTNWSRDRIAEHKAQEASTAATKKKKDHRVTYLNFLQDNATPKLYWPEFKRKYRKESEMKDLNFPEKDREKLYREYITKLKTTEADRKRDFRDLLRSIPKNNSWSRQTTLNDLPDVLLKDLRFYLLRDRQVRDDLVQGYIDTLEN